MIDVSNLKAPGWQRVVADLVVPVSDDRAFLVKLLGVLGQAAGARQGVLFVMPPDRNDDPAGVEPMPIVLWPFGTSAADEHGRVVVRVEPDRFREDQVEQIKEIKAAARGAAGARVPKVFSLDASDQMYDVGGSKGHVMAIPVPGGLPGADGTPPTACAVITLLLDGRSRQAIQTTLAIAEVLAGYAHGHFAQQAYRRTKSASAALDLAGRLISAINSTEGFKGCTLQFVNDLCRALGVDRVALGWVEGTRFSKARGVGGGKRAARCVALSDTENLDRRMAMIQTIEAAMDECLDQEQPVLYPPPPETGAGSDAVLSQAVTHAHRELASRDAKLKAASFPLRVAAKSGDEIVGVLLIETGADAGIDLATMELLQATLDLVAPILAVRHSDDRNLALRTWDTAVKGAAWLVGPRHTVWKLAGVAVLIATFCAVFVKTTYRIGSPFELQARERRVISAPFDGVIRTLPTGVEAGHRVAKGATMVEMDTTDRRLSVLEAESQIAQYEKQADESLKKGELAEAEQHRYQAEQIKARRDLLNYEISKATIAAPIGGTIIAGDLTDKVGAAVKMGDKLFEVADLSEVVVVAKVDDRDITLVEVGQTGEMSPKSNPALAVPFVVERIVPLAQAREGSNTFDVYCRLTVASPEWFRPGMEGQVKFNGPRKPLGWIASRRVLDTLRVWLWW